MSREMTKNDAKEYLNRLRDIQDSIESLALSIAETKELATKVTSSLSPVGRVDGGGNVDSRFSEAITRMVLLQGSLSADSIRLDKIKGQIMKSLSSFGRDMRRQRYNKISDVKLLSYKYVHFWTLREIAMSCGMSEKKIQARHSQALRRFVNYVPDPELWK